MLPTRYHPGCPGRKYCNLNQAMALHHRQQPSCRWYWPPTNKGVISYWMDWLCSWAAMLLCIGKSLQWRSITYINTICIYWVLQDRIPLYISHLTEFDSRGPIVIVSNISQNFVLPHFTSATLVRDLYLIILIFLEYIIIVTLFLPGKTWSSHIKNMLIRK